MPPSRGLGAGHPPPPAPHRSRSTGPASVATTTSFGTDNAPTTASLRRAPRSLDDIEVESTHVQNSSRGEHVVDRTARVRDAEASTAGAGPRRQRQRQRDRERAHDRGGRLNSLLPTLFHPHVIVITLLVLCVVVTGPVIGAPVTSLGLDDSSKTVGMDHDRNAHVTPSAPLEPHEFEPGTTRSPTFKGKLGGDAAEAARIRAAFAAVVDPVGAWMYGDDDEPSGNEWGSHFSLLFGFGGEGSMSVLFNYANGDAANVSMQHRPAAFPNFLAPDADLPLQGTLVPFASLPPPNATAQATSGPNPNESESLWDEPPERACVPAAWPPIRNPVPLHPPIVALVERGGCEFAVKVLAAQERGAVAVVVGDKKLRDGETDDEGRFRESLLTMFSPGDTSGISIPSVFVSRASYLLLRDVLQNQTVTLGHGRPHGLHGIKVDIGPAEDDGSALGSLLTFAFLMPTLFLLATVTAHRVRVARQREANRAPPTVVLSLPERVWTPDIVWEKDSDESDGEAEDAQKKTTDTETAGAISAGTGAEVQEAQEGEGAVTVPGAVAAVAGAETSDDAGAEADAEADHPPAENPPPPPPKKNRTKRHGKETRKSKTKRYYSKDECAICMDNFHRGEIVRILPCGHVFHKDECDEWLLKWRKLCPTCRADVTIPTTDLSASATLTPVVDRDAPPVVVEETWRTRLAAGLSGVSGRVGAAVHAVSDTFRAAVVRPAPAAPAPQSAAAVVAGPGPGADERTPLLGP